MAQSGADLDAMVQQRRAAYTPALPGQRRYWGLALSGGGIRSATFCLGLIKALAQKGQFRQFDLMSTVSGGGYAGSSLGKLLHEAGSAQALEPELARMEASWWLNWLRANGRYLTPNGAKDTLFAFANFGRNLLGVHLELGLMGLLLGCGLAAIDLSVWAWASGQAGSAPPPTGTSVLWSMLPMAATLPTLFLLLPLLVIVAGMLSYAYLLLPSRAKGPSTTRVACTALTALSGLGCVGYATWSQFSAVGQTTGRLAPIPPGWLILGVLFMSAWFGGACLSAVMRGHRDYQADIARNQLTRWLGCILILALATVLLGWVDQLAWHLARNRNTDNLGPALVIVGIALRVALPMIANMPKSLPPVARSALLGLFSIAGIGLLAALLVFWVSVVQGLVTAALFRDGAQIAFYQYGGFALMSLALPVLLLVLTSLGNLDFLNRSSLQPFYRARLMRAYLGASTRERMTLGNVGPMQRRAPNPDDLAVAVPVAEDDIALTDYAPYRSGGAVQLLNVCINQTQDPRGGIFNSDRKGESMTVGPGGLLRVARGGWEHMTPEQAMGLGDWMAISGAAFAPGLGASTRSGLAALLTMAGIRLGYWWDSAQSRDAVWGKYSLLFAELTGRFAGRARRHWFLTDGGHFDNTGAYALLREECELIVLADCGADPAYRFEDLENLVRKARIDLDVDIVFQRPNSPISADAYGALVDLAANDSDACLALAKVHYRATGHEGFLILVKPNLCNGVPVDLQNFKASNPLFPQESTTDQFFSEAQWESYFQLGCRLGQGVSIPPAGELSKHFSNFTDDDGAVIVTAVNGEKQLKFNGGRRVSRLVSTGAVSATLSFGAVASAGIAAWQAFDTQVQRTTANKGISSEESNEINGRYMDATKNTPLAVAVDAPKNPSSVPALDATESTPLAKIPLVFSQWDAVAAAILRVAEQRCKKVGFDDFSQNRYLKTVVETTKNQCLQDSDKRAPFCGILTSKDAPSCLTPAPRQDCAPRYWVRQYAPGAQAPDNCMALAPDDTQNKSKAQAPGGAKLCAGYTVYIQIYGPDLRDAAELYRNAWATDLGANISSIEDVVDTARRQGRKIPRGYAQPTVIQYTDKSRECAEELIAKGKATTGYGVPAGWGENGPWQRRELAGAPDKPIIEVWLPPAPPQEPANK